MNDVVASVSGTIERRRVKAEDSYLKMLGATHAGTRPTSADIADILKDAEVSLDQFEQDLAGMAERDGQRALLETSIEQARAVGPACEAVAALHAERQRWNLEFRDRMSAAIGAEQEARSGAERIPQIRAKLIETSKNPALRSKHAALHAEHKANGERIAAANQELIDGKERAERTSSFLANKRFNSPEQRDEWQAIVNDWPETKRRLAEEIDALQDRQQAIPVEIEELTAEFVASIL